jgi:50S ribosomal subunit-associated GTPase HflX
MYNPKKDIINTRQKILTWLNKIDNISGNEDYDKIFENITKYIDNDEFPQINIPFYAETVEGWKLVKYRNKLEEEYPRSFQQVLAEEKRESRETMKMMKEDDQTKI